MKPLLLLCLLGLACAAPALGDPIQWTDITDATMDDYLLTEAFVAESRWGNGQASGDWEVGVGVPDTQSASHVDVAQLAWTSGTSYDFLLSYDSSATELTYTVGTQTVSYAAALTGNGLLIRLRGGTDQGSAALTIDEVDGSAITPFTASSGTGVVYLMAAGIDLSSDWSIGGTQALTDLGNPLGSRAALQIKGGDIVPEPATLALVGLGLAGITFGSIRRRRRV